jgi:lipid-binding SYLF domain-containing protein
MIFSVKTKLFVMIAVVIVGGCATTHGSNQAERRQAVQNMKNEALAELYKAHPMARAEIAGAPGYAAFSNANVNVIFASFSGGYGVVTDNKSGKVTYMKMGEVGLGLGMGIKDFRAIFVFHDKFSLDRFVNSGWAFGGHADAAAKAGDKGAAVGGEALVDGITIYQFTQSGLALQVTVKGTKYWKDDELN